MPKPSFTVVWDRIVSHEGQPFQTKTDLEFIYKIKGDALVPSRAKQNLPKKHFERAYQLVPFDGPGDITKALRGPAYIRAILHDLRIRQGQW
jgi:hypothetical protein